MRKRSFVFLILIIFLFLSACNNKKARIDSVYENLFSDTDLTQVVSDLEFPSNVDGVDISWKSSNPDVLSNTGKVNRLNQDVNVELQIILRAGKARVIHKITVTVLKQELDIPFVPDYSISNALSKTIGSTVTVQGVIIGFIGENAILHDGEDGITLYQLSGNYIVGNEIQVTGELSDFHGLKQLEDLVDISLISTSGSIPEATTITQFSEITSQSAYYSISEVTVSQIPTSYSLDNNSILKVKDSTNKEIEIIISKNLPDSVIQAIESKLRNVRLGDTIGLDKVISGYYDAWQIQALGADCFIVSEIDLSGEIDYVPEGLNNFQEILDDEVGIGLPNLGTARVLIVPIAFSNYGFTSAELDRLEKAFFGAPEETGWESVRSYYQKSSYQQFDFQGDILDVYQTNRNSRYYKDLYAAGYDADYDIIEEVLDYYDDTIDFSLYDLNEDGYIDGLYLIYAAPVDWEVESLYWAYVYQFMEAGYKYDGVEVNYYLWAGVDFMYEAINYGETEAEDEYIAINASTYIHETGHMLGLEDYYDYDEDRGPGGGLGGADIMDSTIGDHNSFSKLLLDWVTPRVISNKTVTIEIEPFVSSGDVILVAPTWEETYFDEYFLIDFYTPTYLNEMHSGDGLFSVSGIRIYHVDATIDPDVGNPQNYNGYWSIFSYNNSDTDKKLIGIVEADGDNSIERDGYIEDEDLFKEGDIFGNSPYYLNDGSLLNFSIEVIQITDTTATITITFE